MKLRQAVMVLTMSVSLVSLSVPIFGQGGTPSLPARPWPPTRLPDGQPDVHGTTWRPVLGGSQSLDPAMSSASDFEQRVNGVVAPRNPSRIIDPPDGHIPYQPWAAAMQKELEASYENPTRPEHIDSQTRCMLEVPRLYYFPTFRILQQPNSVVFVWEEYHTFRVIPLDNRPRLAPGVKLWMGDGRGRWEGNTLVVETTNLKAKSRLDVIGDFFTDNALLLERFVFVDANSMNYEVTVTDPTVFTRPWTMRVVERRQPDDEFLEWACHEGERDSAVSAGASSSTDDGRR